MPRVKLFNEQEVLTKAMHLFWEQGYAATSVQDLVTHLGINRASLYGTFGDKEQLFKKAFALYRKLHTEGLVQFFETHDDVKTGLQELFDNAIKEALQDKQAKGCFVVNTTTEMIPNDTSFAHIIDENKHVFEFQFYQYLKKGKEAGQFTTTQNLKAMASLLFMLYAGIKVVSKVRPNKNELKEAVTVALSLLQ